MNQPVIQAISQSISQSGQQLVSLSASQSSSQSVNLLVSLSICQSISQPYKQSVSQSVNQSLINDCIDGSSVLPVLRYCSLVLPVHILATKCDPTFCRGIMRLAVVRHRHSGRGRGPMLCDGGRGAPAER